MHCRRISQTVFDHAIALCKDPYGNYVVQTVLDEWPNQSVQRFLQQFASYFPRLALQKYSSNVIEKCILEQPNFCLFAVNTLLANMSMMNIMIHSVFGTFVIESIASSILRSNEPSIRVLGKKFFKCLQDSIYRFIKDETMLTKWNKKIRFYTLHHYKHKCI